MKTLQVALPNCAYPIHIGPALFTPEVFTPLIKGRQVMVISNPTIAKHHLAPLLAALSAYEVDSFLIADGEEHKNLTVLSTILDELIKRKHKRSTTLIALGGGVIGDITGFAASCFLRGVNFIQCPTTLLAQVDASVGGMTGVNHPLGKNLIGAFKQPQGVVINTDTVKTLARREFISGIAEIIKHAAIRDAEFFNWLENHSLDDEAHLSAAIFRSCQLKAEIVALDEREQGLRALLNFGHTFAHALETHTQYKMFLHGEAVAIGMAYAARLSALFNTFTANEVSRLIALIEKHGLPTDSTAFPDYDKFLTLIQHDKKNTDKGLTFVLLKALGEGLLMTEVLPQHLATLYSK